MFCAHRESNEDLMVSGDNMTSIVALANPLRKYYLWDPDIPKKYLQAFRAY